MKLYKLVVRDKFGQVKQVHEVYFDDILDKMGDVLDLGFSVTVTELVTEEGVRRLESCGSSGRR